MPDDATVPDRFVDETLGDHWTVDETPESFAGLCNHLENNTNFRSYFETAFADPDLKLGFAFTPNRLAPGPGQSPYAKRLVDAVMGCL